MSGPERQRTGNGSEVRTRFGLLLGQFEGLVPFGDLYEPLGDGFCLPFRKSAGSYTERFSESLLSRVFDALELGDEFTELRVLGLLPGPLRLARRVLVQLHFKGSHGLVAASPKLLPP